MSKGQPVKAQHDIIVFTAAHQGQVRTDAIIRAQNDLDGVVIIEKIYSACGQDKRAQTE